jgi:hypothetical protein
MQLIVSAISNDTTKSLGIVAESLFRFKRSAVTV